MEVNFAGGPYKTFSKTLNPQECNNWFVHSDNSGDASKAVLRGSPGLKPWCETSVNRPVRGLHVMNGSLFAVMGSSVFIVNSSGGETQASTSILTEYGPVSMADDGTNLVIVDGVSGYTVTNSNGTPVVTAISDDAFPGAPMTVTQRAGYFFVTSENTQAVHISDLGVPTSWDSTMYFSAEGSPDNNMCAIACRDDIVVFGEHSIEYWWNSGIGDVPFDRKPGYTQDIGTMARFSIAKLDNTLFFLTDKSQVAMISNAQPSIISNRAIEHQISQYDVRDDAIGMIAEMDGNIFYILTFPTENATWCFNAVTGMWNTLSSYPSPYMNRWRGMSTAYLNGDVFVGDVENGKIYKWDFSTFTDNGKTIRRRRVSPPVYDENKILFHHRLELIFQPGVGLDASVQGSTPYVMMKYSDDGGYTWSNELWRSVGAIGRYDWRVVFDRLGGSRRRVYMVEVSDPVEWNLVSANLEVERGDS